MPRIDELSGALVSDSHEEAERDGAVAGGVVVDVQAYVANTSAKELAIEDDRLSAMQVEAQIYANDLEQQSSQLTVSVEQPWGWNDRETEGQTKAICTDFLDEASSTTAALLDALKTSETIEQAQRNDDALKQVLREVETFREVVERAYVDDAQSAATVDQVREAFERAQDGFSQLRNEAFAGKDVLIDSQAGVAADYEAESSPADVKLERSVSTLDSMEAAKAAGVPDLLYQDGTVMTRADFPEILPDQPTSIGLPAPEALPLDRPVSESDLQNTELAADILLAESAGATNFRVNQRQVIEDVFGGTNRPDLYFELNESRIHIEYDRFPMTRAMDHARDILSNDPDAIVILKGVDHDH